MASSVGSTSSTSHCSTVNLRSTAGWRQSVAASQPSRIGGDLRMTEDRIANTAQQEYWNTVAGPRWVGFGGLVERCVRAVNDLLLARSAVIPGESVLEISCGTGAATVPFAEAVGERGRVVGVDISEPMLGRRPPTHRRKRARQHLAGAGRCAGPPLRRRPLRSDCLALWRHVFCRSGRSVQQSSTCGYLRRDWAVAYVLSVGDRSRRMAIG